MNDAGRLSTIRTVHTAIYIVMATSTFVLVYAGITGETGIWLWGAMALLAIETAVFTGFGFKCPLSGLAVKYGAKTGRVFDTFLPERLIRYTFQFFGTVMAIGLLLLIARWSGLLA